MSSAGLHIAIFSQKYAESPWCLAELSFMLKTGTPIIPVFYHIKPDDLRWVGKGKGCYAPAFSDHKKKRRYSSKTLSEWKTALERVSNLSGHVLNSNNDDEGKLLKSIVNSVLAKMKRVPLDVAKHPVAVDEIVQDFERTRGKSIQSEEHAQIVGIVGFGGSGKTTLATEIYNRRSSSFPRSSFLHDVRDAAPRNVLHTKQKKLLEDLRVQTAPFDNVKEGKAIVTDRLKSLCMLIVLDDVDHEDQLDGLLPPKESIGSGSLVIVTTREGDVLTKWAITSVYKMQPLQHLHARQLFCWHAFLQPLPQEGFEDLVENCIAVCNGLPLSLKVIGAQLYGKTSRDYWVSQVGKIQRILPKEIMQRLKVSYDALDRDEQEIFLDIACFFIGKRRSSAIAVWDGSGWSGLCSWETLHNKCLVEVDQKERIRMHDHLRDLGRDIATTHSPSRFWSEGQSMHTQGGMSIRGIKAAISQNYELPVCPPPFREYMEMMRISNVRVGLKLLLIKCNAFSQQCQQLSRGLLWLRCYNFEHKYIPSWLSLENIRVLELISPESLETLWEKANPPLQLRELLIKYASLLQSLPRSIGHLKHLKRLFLIGSGTIPLSSLPEEFCLLHSLEYLSFEGCASLSRLPTRFGDLFAGHKKSGDPDSDSGQHISFLDLHSKHTNREMAAGNDYMWKDLSYYSVNFGFVHFSWLCHS
ncbi:hypothetical protein SUGI_0688580 [Cryptomeria japonica]|nr:hypothetical protein SUGI_0688580 [Cryptomeria japonica]